MPSPLLPRSLHPPGPISPKRPSSGPPRQSLTRTMLWGHTSASKRVTSAALRQPRGTRHRRHVLAWMRVAPAAWQHLSSRTLHLKHAPLWMRVAPVAASLQPPGLLGSYLPAMQGPSQWTRSWGTCPTVGQVLAPRLRKEPPAIRGSTLQLLRTQPRGGSRGGRAASWTSGLFGAGGPLASGAPVLRARRQLETSGRAVTPWPEVPVNFRRAAQARTSSMGLPSGTCFIATEFMQ